MNSEVFCRRGLLALFAALVACGLNSALADAEFGIEPGTFKSDTFDPANGKAVTQAGAHPSEATTELAFRFRGDALDGSVRDIDVELPRGFIGNPEATPKCPRGVFDAILATAGETCPVASQVGVAQIYIYYPGGSQVPWTVPVYNLEPEPGQVADFGLPVAAVPVHMVAEVNADGEYSLSVKLTRVSRGLPLSRSVVTLWGVPADRSHDGLRACGGDPYPFGTCSVNAVKTRPFLTNPTECAGPQTSILRVDSWQNPGVWKEDSYTTESGVTGCDRLRFEPSVRVTTDSPRAGAPAGYAVDIDIPQNDDPYGLATPALRDAVVTLPAGAWISPSAADGLGACTDAQFAYRVDAEPTCPDNAKIGTVEVTTPLLSEKMQGEVFLGQPQRGNLFRLFVVLRGPGLLFKLPGTSKPNLATGQITTTFDDNPPIPFSNFHLEFKGGPRAPLSNPSTCGRATTSASFTAWGVDTPVASTSSFNITQKPNGQPCGPKGFAPTLRAGLVNPAAGTAGTFVLRFARGDDDQIFRDAVVNLPQGLTGVIASVTPCADAQASAGACGEESRIGSATNSAGPGTNPFFLPGRVYLTGPYKGAPLGLSVVVPAIAGPFDLGTVVVRTAVFVDRNNTELRIISDPFPTILEGVPLQIRSVNVTVDKPGFMLSPTSCSEKSISSVLSSYEGAVASQRVRFQVGGCASLPFAPRMALKVGARGKLTRGKRTPLEVRLTMPPRGSAANRAIQVTLPKTLNARLDVVNRRVACSIEQFRADRCPMVIGSATAVTPLLRDPLRGPAYFVYNPARRLPDLVVRLKGQIDIDLVGKVTITRGLKLQTTFDAIPDQPISSFRLRLESGSRNGAIGVTRNLCSKATRRGLEAALSFTAHSNRKVTRDQPIRVAGCGRAGGRSNRSRRTARSRRTSRSRRASATQK
jgi:hypothetical protein